MRRRAFLRVAAVLAPVRVPTSAATTDAWALDGLNYYWRKLR